MMAMVIPTAFGAATEISLIAMPYAAQRVQLAIVASISGVYREEASFSVTILEMS